MLVEVNLIMRLPMRQKNLLTAEDQVADKKYILYIALGIGIFNGYFWNYLPKDSYYKLNALFLMLLCVYLFLTDKKSFIKFYLVSLSFSNLLDELFFDPTKITLNEILLTLILPIFWLIKHKRSCLKNWFNRNFRNS